MGLGRVIKKAFKPVFNYEESVGVENLKDNAKGIRELAKDLFIPNRAKRTESLDEAKQRLHLNNDDIRRKQNSLKRLMWFMLTVSLVIFSYFCYLAYEGHIAGAISSFAVSFIPLVLAFRYHFWQFQLKKGKLGCSFKEWFFEGLMGKR